MSDKPQIVKLNPANLDQEIQGPVLCALVDKGWTLGTTVILEDPRAGEGDRIRIGLIMLPPRDPPSVEVKPDPVVRIGVVVAALGAVASFAVLALGW